MEKGFHYYVNCKNYESKKEFADYLIEKGFILEKDITCKTPYSILIIEGGYPPTFYEKKDNAGVCWCLGAAPTTYSIDEFKKMIENLKPVPLDALSIDFHNIHYREYIDIVVEDVESFNYYCTSTGINVTAAISPGIVRIYKNKSMENVKETEYYYHLNDLLDGRIIPYMKKNNKTYMILSFVKHYYYRNIGNLLSDRIYETHDLV